MAPNLANVAPRVGFAVNTFVILFGVVGFFGDAVGVAIYTFMVGMGIAPLEAPILCRCMPQVQTTMLEKMRMNNWLLRGIVYIMLTIIMCLGDVWTVLAGVSLFVCGILYIIAQAQGLREPEEVTAGESAPIV